MVNSLVLSLVFSYCYSIVLFWHCPIATADHWFVWALACVSFTATHLEVETCIPRIAKNFYPQLNIIVVASNYPQFLYRWWWTGLMGRRSLWMTRNWKIITHWWYAALSSLSCYLMNENIPTPQYYVLLQLINYYEQHLRYNPTSWKRCTEEVWFHLLHELRCLMLEKIAVI
jgi:hypothetical protein